MTQDPRQVKRIAERMKMIAKSVRIAADVIESLSKSVRDLADLLEETPEDEFATVS